MPLARQLLRAVLEIHLVLQLESRSTALVNDARIGDG